mmetsp:Transcript_39519/g.53680  ORF Transcript_39519/g.53680 Transcript_39519/m.53680 type:complete len:857 (-) Transcript_39519:307-2877(-)|eukprot:CAMPEP_0185780468 /NCGR_PEP_ID=MMETSP1174-20130828/99209_1 /TAXON_ID=35687 /ORGANISM="Dictyocha speculum, Strain CCMP1381" /LENGTH=856 /DNA_ID=CAMNT_0028470045 /DNA_START=72 /DNA_END=2642 /DNA_ORIENTATION=+
MSIKLRELIRAVRGCKTAQEERSVISKECALIRTAFKENNIQFRHRNVAKLLFIHMLGHPSHFGQMECLKLIASPNFPEKRIGYLALMLLLDERTEVLTLVTNSIKNDLSHQSQYVVGLALAAVGNLANADMGRILITDTDRVLRGTNPYLKKKAALVMIRIFKRVPEMIEEFADKIVSLLKERTHGVLITSVQLMIEMVELDAKTCTEKFARLVPSLVRLLKNLLSMGYSPEHDVAGITDPFLQVKLLRLLQLLGQGNEEASDSMNDILAQVATNTETAKNAGNAILYECVKVIMTIEAESGLRVLAVNILGRFLLNRDNNIRYVALNTLSKVVTKDMDTVQRHRATIVDCLKDPDISIRQRALELIYQVTSSKNVTELMREMLNYLVVASADHKSSLCSKIMVTVDKFSPSRRWQIDTLITMLSIAGNSCDASIGSNTVMYISQSEELQPYVVHKLFDLLEDDLSQLALVHVGVWCFGEYGNMLIEDSPALDDDTLDIKAKSSKEVVDLLEKIKRGHFATSTTKSLIMTTFMKLSHRFGGQEMPRITNFMEQFKESMDMELQQRACEFSSLLEADWDSLRPMALERMPVFNQEKLKAKHAREDFDFDDDDRDTEEAADSPEASSLSSSSGDLTGGGFGLALPAAGNVAPGGGADLLDLDDIFGGGPPATTNPASNGVADTPPPAPAADLLADIFASPQPAAPLVQPTNTLIQPAGFGGTTDNMFGPMTPAVAPSNPLFTAFEKNGLQVSMELIKTDPADPRKSDIKCRFTNSSRVDMTGLVFQAAVPKSVSLLMKPPSGTTIPKANAGVVEQVISVTNTQLNVKNLMLKMKIQYMSNGQQVVEQAQVNTFPSGY